MLQLKELDAVWLGDDVVGVQPENIIAGRQREGVIPRSREVILPGELKNSRSIICGYLLGTVAGSRIHNDDFIHQIGNGG
ncbi:hypothetical protein D3C74_263760 [compost metagenome]